MKEILIIDDDIYIGNMLEEVLSREGYLTLRAYSGTEAQLLLKDRHPDLILLDLMLPGICGEEVLKQIRGIPVIVVSAKADIDSKVELLLQGAVDYVTKPFSNRELLARISVALRGVNTDNEKYSYKDIELNATTRCVTVLGREIRLTRTEYAILKLLMQNPKQIVTRSVMLDRISYDTPDCTEGSLKMHVSNLRKKLRDASQREYIEAVWGIGFKLCD